MIPVTLDFETFFSKEYSLTKLDFVQYIKDARFEAISVAIKIGDGRTMVYWGEDVIREKLQEIDWATHAAVAHNGNEFDFPVLVWKFDCHPALFIDTVCLARPAHQAAYGGVSLAELSETYDLPTKQTHVLHSVMGKRYLDWSLEEMRDFGQYNRTDTDNCHSLFKILARSAGKNELLLSDMTARMICYPAFEADRPMLQAAMRQVELDKDALLHSVMDALGVLTVDDALKALRSNLKFADVLREYGVEPPMKTSPTTGQQTHAFAKTDPGMVELTEHEDPRIQLLAQARLGSKSTLLETRLARMNAVADAMDGRIPVPLAFHAATTGRWGGRVWNPQNLPRISRDKSGNIIPKPTNALRMSLRAPKGCKVIVADLSGIELRVNHYLWGVHSTAALYAADPKADLYVSFGARMKNKSESDVTKDERQLAKVAQLGLGFGAGAPTFVRVAKNMGGIVLTEQQAQETVAAWRAEYSAIVNGWKKCTTAVSAMRTGATFCPDPRGLVTTSRGALLLPSGRTLHYPMMRNVYSEEYSRNDTWYGWGKYSSRLTGPLLDENIVQAIARDVIGEQALQFKQRTGYIPALMVHDELVYVVPESEAESLLGLLQTIMRTPPSWLPGIVLWSEGDIADSYGEAK